MSSWIPVIVNPAAGKDAPVLQELNRVFHASGVRWSVEITQGDDDAILLARRLSGEGAPIVAAYGGDGTISEVAAGLAGTSTALAILPGGTGNAISYEFGIPRNYVEAAQLLVSQHEIRVVDMGMVGERMYLLRAGVGLEAMVVEKSPRRLKDRFGLLAYGIGGLQALIATKPVLYTLILDGDQVEVQGVACTVANSGHLGLPGLSLAPTIDIEDGLLDVIVLRKADLSLLINFLSDTATGGSGLGKLQHWQVERVVIEANPAQTAQVDGDSLGMTPIEVHSYPQALRVVVPPRGSG